MAEADSKSKSKPENGASNSNGDAVVQKPFVCDICDAKFSVKISLVRHKIIHTDLYICKFCGKHFSSKYDLEIRHMYIHTNEFPFKCDTCGEGFKRRLLLTQHTCRGPSKSASEKLSVTVNPDQMTLKRKSIEGDRHDQPTDFKHAKLEPSTDTSNEIGNAVFSSNQAMGIPVPTDPVNYEIANGSNIQPVSQTEMTMLTTPNNFYEQQLLPSNNIVYDQNVSSYEQMLPTTVFDQSTMPASNDIYNLTAVPISNHMYDPNTVPVTNNMYTNLTGTEYVSTDNNNYNHIEMTNTTEMNNYIQVQSEQSSVIPVEQHSNSSSNPDLINSLSVPATDGANVKNELLTMLMSGTSLENYNSNLNAHLYSTSGVSNQGATKGLPTFRDTFAQNSQYVLSPQPTPVMNTFINPNMQLQNQTPDLPSDVKSESYTSPSTPDSVMTNENDDNEELGSGVKRRSKNFKCHICNKRYHKQSSVDRHMRIHLDPYVCNICEKRFLSKIHLEKHLLAHNAEDNMKNNVSSGLDDILETVSSVDFVVENDKFTTAAENEDSISDSFEDDAASVVSHRSTGTEDKPFTCSKCKKSYQTQHHLDKHMIIHTNPYVCTICRKKFLRLEYLEKHVAMHRAEEEYRKQAIETAVEQAINQSPTTSTYQSSTYGSIPNSSPQFTSAGLVQLPTQAPPSNREEVQTEKIRPSKPFACNFCKKSYVLESHLAKHMVLHNNPFKCHICSKTFTTQTFLCIHLRKFHDEKLPDSSSSENLNISLGDYDTDNALLSEINLNEINPTVMEHLSQNQIPLLSPTSTQNDGSLSSTIPDHDVSSLQIQTPLVTNLLTEVQESKSQNVKQENPQLLAVTNKPKVIPILPAPDGSPLMMVLENESKLKPYACTYCNKRYQLQSNLTAHMRVHTDPVVCKICGKKFASEYLLNKLHMPVHNVDAELQSVDKKDPLLSSNDSKINNTETFPSVQANTLNTLPSQQVNETTVMPKLQVPEIVPSMEVNTLDKPQEGPAQSLNHTSPQTALDNKPYACHFCNKRYSVKINLTKHMVIHMNPFVCKICGKKFLSKKSLEEKHMPVHANELHNQIKSPLDQFPEQLTPKDNQLSKQLSSLENQLTERLPSDYSQTHLPTTQIQKISVVPVPVSHQKTIPSVVVEASLPEQTVALNEFQQKQEKLELQHQEPKEHSLNTSAAFQSQSNIYSCSICQKPFSKKDKLDAHFVNHSRKFSCLICGKSFDSRQELEEVHFKEHQELSNSQVSVESNSTTHNGEAEGTVKESQTVNGIEKLMAITYDCPTCGKKYNNPKFLKRHLKLHTGEFACKICGKLFSNQYLLDKKHMLTHLDQTAAFNPELGIGLFNCSFCKKTYTFKKNLEKHLDKHQIPAHCKVCPHVCVSREDLIKHQTDHLDNEMTPMEEIGQPLPVNATEGPPTLQYFAAVAVMMYPRGDEVQLALGEKLAELTLQKLEQDELQQNTGADENDSILTEEKDSKSGWIDCPHCDKKYSQKQYLERHMTVHTNPFVCKICGKAFSSSYALNVKHMLTHSEDRPFKCSVCEMSFKEMRRLREHVRKKHYDLTPHVCTKCGFRFQEEQELDEHLKTHIKQNFRCGDCLKLCHSQFTLNEHMKSHTGQKKVHCEQCGNMFIYQSMFDKHLLYTDKENIQYVCPPCSQSFSDKAQFYVIGLVYEEKLAKKDEIIIKESSNGLETVENLEENGEDKLKEPNVIQQMQCDSVIQQTNFSNENKNDTVCDSVIQINTDTEVCDNTDITQTQNISDLKSGSNQVVLNSNITNETSTDPQKSASASVSDSQFNSTLIIDGVPSENVQCEKSVQISKSFQSLQNGSQINSGNTSSLSHEIKTSEPGQDLDETKPSECSVFSYKPNPEYSILKSALTKPTIDRTLSEPNRNSQNASAIEDKVKDFKTFTDIMIEKLVCNDDNTTTGASNNQLTILDQILKSEAGDPSKSTM